MRCIAVVTTVGRLTEAQTMARALVERRLAACAQIESIESFYSWNGALQHEPEHRVLLKTIAPRFDELAAAIRSLHSYELPAIHALTLDPIDPLYARWIEQQCTGAGP
jgi:periplasmic divalent cation tolerance protein